ncbi:hypothetical protein [Rhodococcus sp. HNM0569]|uniref:hypothetical protein n=1 Tax=Rhodococcus sp. HNM0569 TaxID=2716340 RepID=UPI00146CA93E|nr:hypothetical protein [Rhodococcus sp. HNM0569]NLU81442.1 hypothetical protein [Rhodococcus sp. HNM0569]
MFWKILGALLVVWIALALVGAVIKGLFWLVVLGAIVAGIYLLVKAMSDTKTRS